MAGYAFRRLLWILPTLAVIVTVAFFLVRAAPGGPFDAERSLPPDLRASIEAAYGLDRPLVEQYARYVGNLLRGDFGPSYRFQDHSVGELIAQGLPVSLALGGSAVLLALLVGVPLGVAAALRRNRLLDHVLTGAAVLGIALPVFVVAPLLVLVFAVWLGWVPAGGWQAGRPTDLLLPVVSLALPLVAFLARLTRGSVLETLRLPFVLGARARGLAARDILLLHVLPAALVPVIAYLGPAAAATLAGSLVVESVFSIPGAGRHLVQGALNRDYTLVMGMVIVYAALVLLANLAVDLLCARLDPRVRAGLRA